MIISDKYQFVYIDVPKTGSTSFDQFFCHKKLAGKIVPPENSKRSKHCRTIPAHAEQYTKIISVRNPYRRFQSLYCYYLRKQLDKANTLSVDDFSKKIIEEKDKYQNSGFTMYLSMSEYLKPFAISKNDYIIQLENANSNIAALPFDTNGIKLPWKNASDKDTFSDQAPATIAKINQWAGDDFDRFGYLKKLPVQNI